MFLVESKHGNSHQVFSSTCLVRMIPCECCDMLLDVEKEVDGVLLCKRCGFLTILDLTLRSLVQITGQAQTFSSTHLNVRTT